MTKARKRGAQNVASDLYYNKMFARARRCVLVSLCACALWQSAPVFAAEDTAVDVNSTTARGFLSRAKAMYDIVNYAGCVDQLALADGAALTPTQRQDAAWLNAMASYHLGYDNAETLLRDYLRDYPASTRREQVRMTIADFLFTRNFAEALQAYMQVDRRALSPELQLQYDLRISYCYLKLGEYDRALPIYDRLRGTAYDNEARFYQGYIAYVRKDYDKALGLLTTVNTATAPGDMADYYLCQIYYARGDYNQSLRTAQKVLDRRGVAADFTAEANRIAGESLYLTGDTDGAIPYLRRYVGIAETPLLSSLYILGISEYRNAQYEAAVKDLRPVSAEVSSMGQNANLYIGQSLLRLGDKDGAIMAFDKALGMDFDPKARENAYYNYAVAKYMGGNVPFGSSVETFEKYLALFPNSAHADQVRQYIITGYLADNNYEAALESINRTAHPSSAVLAAKQQILYTLGSRALAGGRITDAISNLEQAAELSRHSARVARETNLTLGEAYLRDGRLDDAAPRLLAFLDAAPASDANRPVALYDLGYVRMGQKDYHAATLNFERLTASPGNLPAEVIADAWTRLGDARYYRSMFAEATEAYRRAADTNPRAADFPTFQIAVIEGYNGDYNAKLTTLSGFATRFPESPLMPDALLEMAEAQVRLGRTSDAMSTLRTVASDYATSAQGRQAYLQLAMTQEQSGNRQQAIDTYRDVVRRYPTSDEAAQAVEILKRIAASDGSMAELMDFVASIDNAPSVDVSEADRLSFRAAEDLYLEQDDISRLQTYVNEYPSGSGTLRALVYLMEEADGAENDNKAYEYACRIVSQYPDNAAVEDALALKADIEYDRGQATQALASWKLLAQKASSPELAVTARVGIMRVARDMSDADAMTAASEAVLSSNAASSEEKTEARFTRGLAAQLAGDNATAQELWQSQADLTEDIYGAKSAVYLAQSLLDEGKLEKARKVADDFVAAATSHTYWLGRGFIVLSDIARAQGNTYEADAFLEALRKNYPGRDDDIFTMISERLSKK